MMNTANAREKTFSGQAMRAAREASGMTRRGLSGIVGITEMTISCYENDSLPNVPDINVALKIASALQIKLQTLFV